MKQIDKHRQQDKGKARMRPTMCWSVNEAKDEDGKWSQQRGEGGKGETAMKNISG